MTVVVYYLIPNFNYDYVKINGSIMGMAGEHSVAFPDLAYHRMTHLYIFWSGCFV